MIWKWFQLPLFLTDINSWFLRSTCALFIVRSWYSETWSVSCLVTCPSAEVALSLYRRVYDVRFIARNGCDFSLDSTIWWLYIPIYIQQDATFPHFISGNCSTCFGWYLHPSSGAHTTLSAASGTCQTVMDRNKLLINCIWRYKNMVWLKSNWTCMSNSILTTPCFYIFKYNLFLSITVWQVPDAADKVVCAPDDGWRYHPKHVEQFPEINKLYNVAAC